MSEFSIVGLDLAKSVFQAHGAAGDGLVLFRKKLRRDHVAAFFAELPRCRVASLEDIRQTARGGFSGTVVQNKIGASSIRASSQCPEGKSAEKMLSDALTIFVLAHPDDEVLFWPLIARAPQERLALLFLTDGSADGTMAPAVRASETQRMLAGLGINPEVAIFLGRDNRIRDGALHTQMDAAWAALSSRVNGLGPIGTIYTHAWEGGHSDHDICHALSVALGRHFSASHVRQVACYRRPDSGIAPYSLLDPIADNGILDKVVMTFAERRAMAKAVAAYPSQWRSWLGLGPPLLARLALSSAFPVQPVSEARLRERPHAKPLLYEVRSKLPFAVVSSAISSFMARLS